MLNINIFIEKVLSYKNQELSENKEIMVRLEDVVSVLNQHNAEVKALEDAATERRSQAMKQAWAEKKLGDKKGDKKKGKK